MQRRTQTRTEELANTLSHGFGFLLAAAAWPMLVGSANAQGGIGRHIGAAVFAATMTLTYLASAIYHGLPEGRLKQLANRLDHAAIFLFIAGSYTPFALGAMRGSSVGWTMFCMAWGVALVGVALKLTNRLTNRIGSTALYFVMGWFVLVAAGPLVERIGEDGFRWLLAGGIAYTVGAVFFLLDERVRFAHFVWHVFVLVGSACHFLAVLRYA